MTIRKEVEEFAEAMEYKLSMHDDRPGWKECDSKWLIARMREEITEVEKVLLEHGNGWLSKLYGECADVGNFAMMIYDAERTQWVNRKAKELEPLPTLDFM